MKKWLSILVIAVIGSIALNGLMNANSHSASAAAPLKTAYGWEMLNRDNTSTADLDTLNDCKEYTFQSTEYINCSATVHARVAAHTEPRASLSVAQFEVDNACYSHGWSSPVVEECKQYVQSDMQLKDKLHESTWNLNAYQVPLCGSEVSLGFWETPETDPCVFLGSNA